MKRPAGLFALIAPLPDGPDSPSLSMLRCCWRDYLQEEADAEEVLWVLEQVASFVEFELESLRQQAAQGISDPENPAFQAIVDAFGMHLEANRAMAQEFAEDNSEQPGCRFVSGYTMAQKATEQLIAIHQETMDHIQAMAFVDCLFCKQSNPRERERCAQCGRNLPGPVIESSSFSLVEQEGLDGRSEPAPTFTQNFAILDEAVDNWQAGDLDDAGLLAVVEMLEVRLLDHQRDSQTYPQDIEKAPAVVRESLYRALTLTQQALDESLAALEQMRRGFRQGIVEHITRGFEQFEEASTLMVHAYRQSREAACKG